LQLEAASIVTGLPIFASSILIYKELTSTLFPFDVSSVRMSIHTISLVWMDILTLETSKGNSVDGHSFTRDIKGK
jgi:hypothetical protein